MESIGRRTGVASFVFMAPVSDPWAAPRSEVHRKEPVPRAPVGSRRHMASATRREVFEVYDQFLKMDRSNRKRVTRADFIDVIRFNCEKGFLRFVRRGRLRERFRASATEMAIEEVLHRFWPRASKKEMEAMVKYTVMRDLQRFICQKADKAEMDRLVKLIDKNGDGELSREEVTAFFAGFLKPEDITELSYLLEHPTLECHLRSERKMEKTSLKTTLLLEALQTMVDEEY